MPRATNAVASRRRRKKILKMAKGYFGARKNVYTVAKNAVEKALLYAYRDRKARKRDFRRHNTISNSTAKCWPISPLTTPTPLRPSSIKSTTNHTAAPTRNPTPN